MAGKKRDDEELSKEELLELATEWLHEAIVLINIAQEKISDANIAFPPVFPDEMEVKFAELIGLVEKRYETFAEQLPDDEDEEENE